MAHIRRVALRLENRSGGSRQSCWHPYGRSFSGPPQLLGASADVPPSLLRHAARDDRRSKPSRWLLPWPPSTAGEVFSSTCPTLVVWRVSNLLRRYDHPRS